MERKPSAKANKMRNRLTFTRSASPRDRAATLVSPTASSPPRSRPRSASNPESPTHDEPMWDNHGINSSRGYTFTDEIGYFRPASPYIDRQEIHEDIEADIKHACALLSHSIDRGVPAGLSYQSAVPDWTGAQKPAGQPSADVPSSLEQHVIIFPAPKPINIQTESTKKHDSGVGMSFSSPHQPGRGNSVSGTVSSARFYNKQSSASPPGSPSQDRLRFQSQSRRESIQPDEPGELSFCSSPVPFPYSPPQMNGEWPSSEITLESPVSPLNETDKQLGATASQPQFMAPNPTNGKAIDTSSPSISPTEEPCLGEEGMNWLRASRNIQHLADEENAKNAEAKAAKTTGRFYSGNNHTTGAFNSREWLTKNFWEDRDPSVYGEPSLSSSHGMRFRSGTGTPRMGSVSTTEDDLHPGYPYGTWAIDRGMSFSSSCLGDEFKHQETLYSVVTPNCPPPRNRRNKASLLLRKLAGLRLRRKDGREA
ncbi:uncharacterized protein N7529_011047 [Penicillium soppii]|uniref:uncharacterized protein n=1 Tax=Penicillium soppii TaxID=69789 RepID=UPI0025486F75|nr:uncharacterized protein N7529_011047 [Penicillium soppii]KAJ5851662.1 hypothetical protein N7529_011047 [Penicillium soppii]